MTCKTTWHSATAVSEMTPGGVLVIRFSGWISNDALRFFRAEIGAQYSPQVNALVADYTAAALAVTPDEMTGRVVSAEPNSYLLLPAALVVSPELFGVFSEHARIVAGLGVMRRVFSSLTPALQWAEAEVQAPGVVAELRAV